MDGAAEKGINLPLTIFLTILIATFALTVYNKTRPIQKSALSQEDTIISSLTSNNYSTYDNQNVSGGDVISAINTKSSTELTIIVQTMSNTAGVSYVSASYNISDKSNVNYIESTATFHSVLGKTANGTVTTITFTQQ